MVKNLPAMQETCNAGDKEDALVEGNGNPLQYSCLVNSMDGGAWQVIVHGDANSWTYLRD